MLIRNLANKQSINTFCVVYLLYALTKNKLRKSVTSPKNFPIYIFFKSTCKQFSQFIPVWFKGHPMGRKTCAVGIMDREVSEIKGTLKQGPVYRFAGRQWAYCTGSE